MQVFIRSLAIALGIGCLIAGPATAGESPFGWIYTTEVMPPGEAEFETQSFLQHGQSQGEYDYLIQRFELELGLTPRFQLAGYLNFSRIDALANGVDGLTGGPGTDLGPGNDPTARYRHSRFDTASVEAIYQLRNPLTDRFGLALYLEPEYGAREQALEWRVMLQKNLLDDRLILAGNLFGAHERERESRSAIDRASMLDLSGGLSYRFRDHWSAGFELRNHREFSGYWYGAREHSAWFAGPNLHYAARRFWVTLAWRTQLPVVQTFADDQAAVTVGHRIYGDEHARQEFMLKFGIPIQRAAHGS